MFKNFPAWLYRIEGLDNLYAFFANLYTFFTNDCICKSIKHSLNGALKQKQE